MTSPLVTEIYQGVYKASVSIPVPLKAINVYLFKGAKGWSIVDCGFHDQETEKVWENILKELNLTFNHITKIIVTHLHPDHYGAAGWLQEKTGAEVILHDIEKRYVDLHWHDRTSPHRMKQFFLNYGMPEAIASGVEEEHISRYEAVSPHPSKLTLVSENDEIMLGDYSFKVIWCPGHTQGLMTLWNEKERIFIANDHVLPKITPNISLNFYAKNNPLANFITSLKKVRCLPAKLILTGHRELLTDLPTRIDEMIDHHISRLEKIKSIVKEKSANHGVNAWEVCNELFGSLKEPVQHRFAFSEALAHLEYLVEAKEHTKTKVDQTFHYSES